MDRRLFLVVQTVLLALLLGVAVVTLTSSSSAAADLVASPSAGFSAVDGKSSGTAQASPLAPVGSGFTYQGRLDVSGSPASGQFDLQFTLFDAATGGTQVGNPLAVLSQTVANGLFTVQLDFGPSAFQGGARWLEVAVSTAGGGSYTTLAPRQPVSPAPYALSLVPGATVSETLNSPLLTLHNSNQIGLQAYSQSHDGVYGISTVAGRSGVYGENFGGGFGVTGRNNSTNVFTPAVYGRNEAIGTGVFGWGGAYGVIGGSDTGTGVYAYSEAASGFGLYAQTTGSGYGVFARSSSGPGIYGTSTSNSGVQGIVSNTQPAVIGTNNGSGVGIRGVANTGYAVSGTSTGSYGVYGSTAFTTSAGIYGTNTSGHGYGVRGFGGTIDGIGVYGSAGATGVFGTSTGNGAGVRGVVSSTLGGVFGDNTGVGPGVRGHGINGNGVYGFSSASFGVYGATTSVGAGVYGTSTNGPGVRGYVSNDNSGVIGESLGNGAGVYGTSVDGVGVRGTSINNYGVFGYTSNIYLAGVYATNASGRGYGMHASGGTVDGIGVYGTAGGSGGWFEATAGSGVYARGTVNGVGGYSTGAFTSGVYGENMSGGYGVAARSVPTGTAFFADNLNNLAGNFRGNVTVQGSLSKGGGSFKIDHPLDPENKYLYHSFVESPDMMNIYNGNVTLDGKGEVTVELPAWFEALNEEFRYQLTAIGAPGPDLYVAQEVKNNRFKIAGGKAGMKVSWQVTGIRHDPYAEKHRIPVEEEKPDGERGTYLYSDAYGKPESQSIGYDKSQELARQAQPPRKPEPPATRTENR